MPTRPIKIGVQLHPQRTTYEEYRRAWIQLDEMGVDSLWTWDHFFPIYPNGNGPHFEGWTLLAALGALSRNAEVGCLVTGIGYRNPALLSNMAKTVDHITDGRLILGVGAGWSAKDYREFGYEFGTPGSRLKLLERGLEIVKDRWAQDEPRPVRGTIPILLGGGGERVTLRIAALHADIWHGFGAPTQWHEKSQVLDEWCAKVGRDPAAIERSCGLPVEHAGRVDDFVAAGATHLIHGSAVPFDQRFLEDLLAWRDTQRTTRT